MRVKNKFSIRIFLMISLLLTLTFFEVSGSRSKDILVSNVEYDNFAVNEFSDYEIFVMENATTIDHYDADQIVNGYQVYAARKTNSTISSKTSSYNLVIVNMTGDVVGGYDTTDKIEAPEFLNSTTLFFIGVGNITLWNIYTGAHEILPIPSGGHDLEYNPLTDTFMMMAANNYGEFDGLPIKYHDLAEYDRDGNLLWYWNCSIHLPFDEEAFLNEISKGTIDWTHSNAIHWDVEEGIVYYNPRNLDTFYKINKTSGEIIWGAGKLGNFTMYDKFGNEKTSLWYHCHAVEKIGENRFILYDNDLLNQTNPLNEISRMIEVEVDEEAETLTEVWSWAAPADYYGSAWGDADRLPNGNRVGTFAHHTHPAHIVEVNEAGEVVWEYTLFNGTIAFYGIYRSERFYEKPIINLNQSEIKIKKGEVALIELETYNTIGTIYKSNATASIYNSENELLLNQEFQFNKYWQKTNLQLELNNLSQGRNELTLVIENSDGKMNSVTITIKVVNMVTTTLGIVIPIVIINAILVPIIILHYKKGRT